jgi:hypothetical protein
MAPESDSFSPRRTVSVMAACEALGVSRGKVYDYIAAGLVDYVRTPGGMMRLFADSLAHIERRRIDTLKRALMARRARPQATTAASARDSGALGPATGNPFRDEPLFRWLGRSRLVRNAGRPVDDTCPCCASELAVENLYDAREEEYETDERIYCLLCGWVCRYECRPLTRVGARQFYVIKTLRSFSSAVPRTRQLLRRLGQSDGLPQRHIHAVVADVFRGRDACTIAGESREGADVVTAVRCGGAPVVLHWRYSGRNEELAVAALSSLRSVNIDWSTLTMRLNMAARPIAGPAVGTAKAGYAVGVDIAAGRELLEFISVCSRVQPRLEVLSPAIRDEIVARRRLDGGPYRCRRPWHTLFDADED